MHTNKIKIAFLLILLSVCLNNGFSQQPIKFKRITVEDGLSQSWVRCILQDWQGFMWFGTDDGLNKYDGYSITTYYSDSQHSLNSNSILTIYEDKNNNLWIGTDKGLNFLDRATDRFTHNPNWPQSEITYIFEMTDHKFLIATRGDGLLLFHPDNGIIKSFLPDPNDLFSLTSPVVECILKDRHENIWIGSNNELALFDPVTERFTNFRKDDNNPYSLSGNNVTSLLEDKDGRIWVGTLRNGLNILKYDSDHPENSRFIHYTHNPEVKTSISPGVIVTLWEDSAGYLWIGTENGGLDRVDLNHFQEDNVVFEHYDFDPFNTNSLSSNSISSIYEDRDGGIWIGTDGDGICYYHPFKEKFMHVKQLPGNPNSLNNKFINCFFEEGDSLWICTEGGVNLYNKKNDSYKHFIHNPNDDRTIGSNAIWTIYRDSHHNLWFGTWTGGLNLFDEENGTFDRFKHDDQKNGSISSNNVSGILEDQNGNLWISTMGGGLNKFDRNTKTFKTFNEGHIDNSGITNNWIYTFFEDSYGKIWISTTKAVDVYDPVLGVFKHFDHDTSDTKSISNNVASIFFEDSQKNLWIGTNNGLNVYNRSTNNFNCYKKEQGLPNSQIKGILEDARGNLWISTNKGISKFVEGSKRPENPIFINYDMDDGLQGNEFRKRSCLYGQDGKMYFGGNNGFNVFHPDSIIDHMMTPQIVLTNFLINNKPVPIGIPNSPLSKHISMLDEVTLNHKQSVFSLEYTILNYLSPKKNQYAFKLEGFEKDWNYVGDQRFATYTNLDPGEYIFRVKGAIGDSWNQEGVSLRIRIIPPWWKTYWAYLLYFALTGFILFSVWRFQLKRRAMKHELMLEHQHAEKLEELDRMKSRFFANITHEFRSPLTLIMGPMKQFFTGKAKGNFHEIARMAYRNSERLYQLINQILELSKLEAGHVKLKVQKTDIVTFVEKMMLGYAPLAESKKINLQFSVSENLKTNASSYDLYIDHDKIQKVITNLLSNAFKFTFENGNVSISIKKVCNKKHHFETMVEKHEPADDDRNLSRWLFGRRNIKKDKAQLNNQVFQIFNKHGYIEICLKDDGIGIPDENLNRIFDRFYQVADPRTGNYESAGIGLALAKELVELHSGTIHVESAYEHGTTFFVQLPLGHDHFLSSEILDESHDENHSIMIDSDMKDDHMAEQTVFDETEISRQKHHPIILIVDDNPDIRKYVVDNLSKEYRILVAKDGKEGLDIAISQVPDLIVSDVMMPQMNGIDLCSKIKTNELTSHIPVILLTVRASDDSKVEGLEIGADDYITKPFEIRELKARIRNLIEQRRQLKIKFNRERGLMPSEITSNTIDERFLNKALSIIEANMNESAFGVEKLAKEMSISRVQLYRKIRAITGQTAAVFIRSIRLNRAAQLLKRKHDNIGQIAYEVGFSNPSYFSSAFKKQFGKYPTEFAKQLK